jgi:hypothetical protein
LSFFISLIKHFISSISVWLFSGFTYFYWISVYILHLLLYFISLFIHILFEFRYLFISSLILLIVLLNSLGFHPFLYHLSSFLQNCFGGIKLVCFFHIAFLCWNLHIWDQIIGWRLGTCTLSIQVLSIFRQDRVVANLMCIFSSLSCGG